MKKVLYLSTVAIIALNASDIELDVVTVDESVDSVIVKDVSAEELKSADLAEALSKVDPSVSISRRSGIANDIILRGQKRDNINVIVDGGKIYGGCPNRMDPPLSHIVTNNIDSVVINEGPYDVENFGTLSGVVKVKTREPKSGFNGELNLNAGSFGYKKASLSVEGGDDKIRAIISASTESSKMYKDGDGDDFNEQLIKSGALTSNLYQDKYKNMDAYTKNSFIGKVFINLTDNQLLKLSYTANRSDEVLYPNSPMDATKDDSDLYNIEYSIKNINRFSKELDLLYYYSYVDHPMSTIYRNSAATNPEMINHMKSSISGIRIKNSFNPVNNVLLTYGVDSSLREWKGSYYKGSTYSGPSIDNAITKNKAIFVDSLSRLNKNSLRVGFRFDSSDITNDGTFYEPSYTSVNGYIFNNYNLSDTTEVFAGVGISHRVPDARELYFQKSGVIVGTPTLDQTKNTEFDVGINKVYDNSSLKIKLFYSKLDNYIYYNAYLLQNKFVNLDAKIYGVEVSGAYMLTDKLSFEYGATYQRGSRDKLDGKTGTNLADLAPMRGNLITNYDYDNTMSMSFEILAQADWNDYDEENGEQRIPGFAVANFKAKKELSNSVEVSVGMDNILDKTYASSNTYNDITLIVTGTNEKIKLNEPGRYTYVNIKYKF